MTETKYANPFIPAHAKVFVEKHAGIQLPKPPVWTQVTQPGSQTMKPALLFSLEPGLYYQKDKFPTEFVYGVTYELIYTLDVDYTLPPLDLTPQASWQNARGVYPQWLLDLKWDDEKKP